MVLDVEKKVKDGLVRFHDPVSLVSASGGLMVLSLLVFCHHLAYKIYA
jgi:hypothetical protein